MILPKRSKQFGVGKFIGGSLYVHRDYAHVLPQEEYNAAVKHSPRIDHRTFFNVIKYNTKTKAFTFIQSNTFDSLDEPIVGIALLMFPSAVTPGEYFYRWIFPPKDPWIYHHKWLMVGDDYQGFDVEAAKARSALWMSIENINKSRIGKKSYWEAHVVPLIRKHQ